MANLDNLPDDYKLSRSALRRLYGGRAINASAPQSAADDTPSGRARFNGGYSDTTPSGRAREDRLAGRANTGDQANAYWRKMFPAADDRVVDPANMNTRPIDLMRRRAAPTSPLDAIQQAHDTGAISGTFPVPQYGGSVSFTNPGAQPSRTASLMPESPVTGVDEFLGVTPANTPASSLFPFRRRQSPSVLDGAQKWLTQI